MFKNIKNILEPKNLEKVNIYQYNSMCFNARYLWALLLAPTLEFFLDLEEHFSQEWGNMIL